MSTAEKTPAQKQSGGYEVIDDLYVGNNRWTLLCRITRKTFRETKNGHKVLEIELVDKTKKKILGTFFKEAAIEFNDYLKEGSVYEISKGRLSDANYNNSRNEKMSSHNLIFDLKSQFNEVSDISIITKSEDSAITLGEVFEKKIFNQ